MIVELTCPKCESVFDTEDNDHIYGNDEWGKCPNCGNEYIFNFDCDYEDAVLILEWKYETTNPINCHVMSPVILRIPLAA